MLYFVGIALSIITVGIEQFAAKKMCFLSLKGRLDNMRC
jgi:hypothetical protein